MQVNHRILLAALAVVAWTPAAAVAADAAQSGASEIESPAMEPPVLSLGNNAGVLSVAPGQEQLTHNRFVRFLWSPSTIAGDPVIAVPSFGLLISPADSSGCLESASNGSGEIVGVTPVVTDEGAAYEILVRLDSSAQVSVQILDDSGADTPASPSVEFLSPLEISVVANDSEEDAYTGLSVWLHPSVEASESDASLIPILDADGADDGEDIPTVLIPAGSRESAGFTLRNASAFTVRSQDPAFDGLTVQSCGAQVPSAEDESTVAITKQAFRAAADSVSIEQIRDSGTAVEPGSKVETVQPLCFIYTVTNPEASTAGYVFDLDIRDSDESLGDHGLIGTIPALAPGETAEWFACTDGLTATSSPSPSEGGTR